MELGSAGGSGAGVGRRFSGGQADKKCWLKRSAMAAGSVIE